MRKWEKMPKYLKNNEVKKYYDILQKRKFSLFVKRFMDILFSVIGLVAFFPIFLILGIAIKIDSKGPIFFRQERVTIYNKTFKIFKFRTMVQNADKMGSLVTIGNDRRITKVGNFIRKFRLDEFPQLINILIGDMSFIGTRPEVRKYVDAYTNEMKATLLMRAGVTSFTSIVFKDEAEIMEKYIDKKHSADDVYINKVLPLKMKTNLEYIKKFNAFYDIKIAIWTVLAVLGLKKFDNEFEGDKLWKE